MMLILLPSNGTRKLLYVVSTDYLTGGTLVIKKWKTKTREAVPSGPATSLPVIYKYKEIGPHRFALTHTNTRIDIAAAGTVRKHLYQSFEPFIIREPKWWRPRDAWRRIRWGCSWCRRYWVVTNKVVYPMGTEPAELYIKNIIVAGPVVVMLS